MSTITLTTQGGLRKAQVRAVNERVLLNLIRQTPGISRSDIVRITGFSSSSVTFIVSRMIRDGLLCEADVQAPPQVGRRPVALRLRPEAMTAIGVEVARPEARIIVAGLHGEPLRRRVVPWQADPKLFLGRVRDAIRALAGRISGKRLLGVGVSLPGTIDRTTGKVIAAENLGWFDLEAGRMLSEGVPANFYFENNAKLGALAERWFCQPGSKPLENFVFVMARGGLGTGVIIEGKLLHGASGEASEFGHTILYPDGRRCVCGNSGCWEEYASDRALERLYAERRGIANGVEKPDADEIVRLGRNGDELALAVLRETA
ncbi:MAG: ROK family transcriptional regulator, partial [Acidobacteria bacterium]|nr:ROK family transcriptional regulator [Acidobacteriota bacterium]